MSIAVFIVDDHLPMRSTLEQIILGSEEFELTGSCARFREAVVLIPALQPDVVLLDINLGEGADFRVAAVLSKRKISFVFAAGYDRETIPAESSSIICL